MFTLSKTVEIAIMCSTALFAQNNMTDSAKIKVTERPATIEEKVVVFPNDSTSTSSPASKSKFRTNTTNAFGIGGYSREVYKASKVTQLKYIFSGINLTPHLGFFCAF